MHLTQYTDFGLRLLLYLGAHPDETVSVATVSQSFGISENHLAAVAKRLVLEGVLIGKRGRSGGVRLARDPSELRLGQLVMLLERSHDLVECFDRKGSTCPIAPVCILKGVLYQARDAFFASLDRHTLADLLRNKNQLVRVLRKASLTASA